MTYPYLFQSARTSSPDRRTLLRTAVGSGLVAALGVGLSGGASLLAGPALAHGVVEPGRGSALRRQILDALRPSVVRDLGAPIEFVVSQMRVAGAVCFTQVECQRPGGRPIDLARTPLAQRQDLSLIDGTRTEAFLFRTAGRWQVEDYAVGATDLWWSDPRFCTRYRAVMPAAMCG